MSLDDIIKSNRKPTGSRGRGGIGGGNNTGGRGGSGSNSGPSRRFANRVGARTAPYSRVSPLILYLSLYLLFLQESENSF